MLAGSWLRHRSLWLRRYGFLAAALLVWSAPVFAGLARYVWSTDQGAQGPLILATGVWLLATLRARHAAVAGPGREGRAVVALAGCALLFVLARMISMLSVQVLCLWLALVILLYASDGSRMLQRLAFPLAYLLFLIPPPFFVASPIVRALKLAIASGAVDVAAALGLEVASSGSTVFIDQYELSIEAACAGLNSIFSLLAIGSFYIYLRHGRNWRRVAVLGSAIVPVAIGANLLRVLLLMASVHLFGSAVLDTALHVAAGLVTAAAAMLLLVALDTLATVLARPQGLGSFEAAAPA